MKIGEIGGKITARVKGTLDIIVPKGVSPLGTLYQQELKFLAGSYTTPSGQVFEYGELKLHSCSLSYYLRNKVVSTPVNGLNGTIKEYISAEDVLITVNGNIVAGIGLLYPEDKILALTSLYEAKKTLKVKNSFLNNKLNVNSVVIEEIRTRDPEDFRVVPFEMSLISDFDDFDNFDNFVLS